MDKQTVIERVTEHFGSAYAAAKAIGIAPQQYYAWRDEGYIPFKRGKQIEELTHGIIKAEEVWIDAGKNHKVKI